MKLRRAVRQPDAVLAVASPAEWNAWLTSNHEISTGVLLRLAKRDARKSIDYKQALDIALAWGWIDSQKSALDSTAWLQRFSPRTSRSPWSKINRAKAEALMATGIMRGAGLAEVERAKADGRWDAAYDGSRRSKVPEDLAAALAKKPQARAFFEKLDSANRYAILYRIQTAKKPETRAGRIGRFVEMCGKGQTVHPTRVAGKM